jgi:FAD/FMN-containing dehydrogenase
VELLQWRTDPPDLSRFEQPVLPFGQGRSYGDTCLNDGGVLLDTGFLSRFISFDETTGVLRCEAGTTLAALLELTVPRGWFPGVTPGTRHVSLGGAIAHDVHGKNHHRGGTFGRDVRCFELLRSNGQRLVCSRTENADLFAATIGGMGLTGLILWAEVQLKKIRGPLIDVERVRFSGIDEFFDVSAESDAAFEYTVAWVDCLARGRALGRGIFFRGNHSAESAPPRARGAGRGVPVPFDFPATLLNRWTIGAFNALYYHRQMAKLVRSRTHFNPFFYPLDALRDWNRLYGRAGFLQYQCVVPREDRGPIRDVLACIAQSGFGSFLAVLKTFGEMASPGMMSFPRPGVTLALDFPFRGPRTLALFDQLDVIVRASGGAVYPAKDARMSAASFQSFFPRWREFAAFVDPKFSSSFWRRVSAAA